MSKVLASIFKSSKHNEMYLYVDKRNQLEKIPETLHQAFGKAVHVMDILLTPERKLARADIEKVMSELQEKGFYLQMPPTEADYIQHLPEELLSFNDPV